VAEATKFRSYCHFQEHFMIFCRTPGHGWRVSVLLSGVFLSLAVAVQAQEPGGAVPAVPARVDLQDGDTLVFLGDSITHQRLYTQYVEDFFYTRYPGRRIRFHNAGIGGARAWDALQRISRDVAHYKPRYVTILLGMNDGSYKPFDAETFDTYRHDMQQVVATIRASGAVPVLMSPTMFDARAGQARGRWDEAMLSQYNSVLAYYGKWLQHQALENGLAFVDMFGLLNSVTVEQRKIDPGFTLIKDAIHPDAPGQLVMAAAMIENLGLRGPLSSIRVVLDGSSRPRATATGGKVTSVVPSDQGIEFDWLAEGLPWVLPEEARLGGELVHLGHRASREALTVHGLAPGRYELSIDDVIVGVWPQTSLAAHVELQGNSKTPQYQQALRVAELNKQKNEGPVKQLRDAWGSFQGWARQSRQLAEQPYNKQLAEQVSVSRARVEKLEETIRTSEAAARVIEDQIYSVNQPVVRHYRLVRVSN
jgi:lysophospholipase L1-like esterase